MAIYKPSNCAPFLSAKDLTQPFNISFEINSSNRKVTGYSVSIYDSENNLIFPGSLMDSDHGGFDEIPDDITALNGSSVSLPLLVELKKEPEPSTRLDFNYNTIFFFKKFNEEKGDYDYHYYRNINNKAKHIKIDKFYNGYPNQPYKWVVFLAQGENLNGATDSRKMQDYDMEIASGTILGSTPNRIQSLLSENIQKDYFIQLYSDEGQIGYRKLISSYDHTYGYIYPQENKFTQTDIDKATYFQIYKFSDDPDVVSASSKVVLKTDTKMQNVKFENKTASEVWGTGSETYPYYFTQKYTGFASKPNIGSFPCSAFDSSASGDLVVGSTIIVNGEDQQKYNGVFTLQSFKVDEVKTKNGDTETTTYDLTVQWLRAATADTWAELVNNVYLVELGSDASKRFQVQVGENETGTINVNNVVFIPEKPVEIYPNEKNPNAKIKGPIYKNHSYEYGWTVFIRPIDAIIKNTQLSYTKKNSSGVEYAYIKGWAGETGNIELEQRDPYTDQTKFIPDEYTYKIMSFFKSSEENPFYAYADPTVEITSDFVTEEKEGKEYYKDSNGVLFYFDKGVAKDEEGKKIENPIFVIGNRLATLNGIFSQDNNKSWVYYQWRMTDLTIGTETITEKGFDGEITWTIYGLQNEHYYQVELYIQDEFGRVASKEITFQVQVKISEKKPFFEVEFDCETNSYKINTTSTGVVIPGLENRILKTKISENGTEDQPFAVQEEQMKDFVAKGDEFQVTDPFETIKDLVVDQGGNSDVRNLVLLKAEKNGNAINNYNAGYNYNPEDKSYSLYVTDLDKPATSSDNLFFYNKMKGDSGGESLIPAPKNDTITINFSNILNNYFEGQVMSYHIGVDSPSTAFNDIEVRVSVTPEIITSEATNLKEVSPDRNKIKVGIYQCLKTTNEDNTLIKEKEFVFYGNPNTRKVCSPWVNPARGAADSNCDYIETDVVYDKDGKKIEGGLNINGEGRYNSNSKISKPITLTKSIENKNTYAVWYDMETEVVEQADETVINYFGDYWDYRDRTIFFKEITLKIKDTTSNLWSFTDNKQIVADSGPAAKRPDWKENIYYYAVFNNNYTAGNLGFDFNSFKIDKNYISFVPLASGAGVARKFNCTPGQTYTLSVQEANGDAYVMYFQEDGTYIPQTTSEPSRRLVNSYLNQKSGSFTIPENCTWFAIQFRWNDNVPFDNYWNDYTNSESPIYRQTSINLPDDGHTGEEIFTNKNLTFSLILSDYNTATKQFAPLEINGKLWNGDEEVPLTEITK